MAYTALTDSNLRIPIGYGEDDLLAIDTYNWQRLANTLLKLSALLDVDDTGKADGSILRWDSSGSEWVDVVPPVAAFTTTTSTTTSTSTTTT